MMSGTPPLSREQRKTFDLLCQRFYALARRKDGGFAAKILEFKAGLLQRYPQARFYVLFSLFSHTPSPLRTGPFDFPGNDSIERFINTEYAVAFPEHALFSMLLDSEPGEAIPDKVQQFLADQYDPTIEDIIGKTDPCEKRGLNWLEKPLQLLTPTDLPESGKVTIPPEEHPFHVEVKDPEPAPPVPKDPPRGLNRLLSHWFSGRNASGNP